MDEIMELTLNNRKMCVLSILANLEGLGMSDCLKVKSHIATDEDLMNIILMCDPGQRLCKVRELLQIINAQ